MSKYLAVLKFRSGAQASISAEHIQIEKAKNSPVQQLFINGEAVATLERGSQPNFDQNNNFRVFNASPLEALKKWLPEDFDTEIPSYKIIDEIFIRTQKS